MSLIFLGLVASAGALAFEEEASARSFRVADIPNGSHWKCLDCHLTAGGSGFTQFGNDAANALSGSGLASTEHVDWKQLCNLDSDGDGQTNGQELGDPSCTWTRGMPDPTMNPSNPGDPGSKLVCGDGERMGNEQCDGNDLGGKTCASLGLGSGTLKCSNMCTFDTSGCGANSGSGGNPTTSGSGSGTSGAGAGGGSSDGKSNNEVSPRNPPPIYPAGCSLTERDDGAPLGVVGFFALGSLIAFRRRAASVLRGVGARVAKGAGPLLSVVLVVTVAAMAALAGCISTSAINTGFGGSGGGNGGSGTNAATTGSRGNATNGTATNGTATNGTTATGFGNAATNGATTGNAATTGVTTGGNTTNATVGATTGSGGGGIPTTCAQAYNGVGCCGSDGQNYYCTNTNMVGVTPCTGGQVCGWDPTNNYYGCVASPGGPDPSGANPMQCGGGGGSTSATTGSTTSSTTSGGGTVTWTMIYDQVFGPNGTSTCNGGGCHTTGTVGNFTCGSTKTSYYNGFVNSGYITPGASAASSAITDTTQSCLCGGSLPGNMPKVGNCLTQAQIDMINSWLATGAPDN